MKTTHPTQRTILGIVAVILIVLFSNWIVRSTSIGNRTLDLTEDHRHSLTPGTKAILNELDHPVIIRYYATRKSEAMPRRIKLYMRKVDDILNRYTALAHGNIQVEHIDPQPDTDAEDSANLDGINGQRINDENLYFGLSISCLDRQTSIPFLDPASETMLEYNLSSAIANVTNFQKKTIALMTSLPLAGMPATTPNGKDTPPWIIYQLLRQRYDLQYLGMHPKELDPQKIAVLLLVHPTKIEPHIEYLIDQYLLKGGIVIAALDPYALTAPLRSQFQQGTPKSSFLPHLLPAWGIGMDATSVIADGKFASDFGDNRRMYAHLALTPEAITAQDDIITQGFENLYFPLAGGFTINNSNLGLQIDTLVESSKKSILISPQEALKPDPSLFSKRTPNGEQFALVMRLQGKFPTAFPEGDPSKTNKQQAATKTLQKATQLGTVYLISDADFLCDIAGFQTSKQGHIAINNNAALLENILDQCTGSKHLIGSRSRASSVRPFTIIKEMETQFAQELRDEVEKAKQSMNKIVAELQELQKLKTNSKDLVLSPEQEEKITQLQEQQLQLRRELREKQKSLRARKNKLYSKITWLTVAVTPTFIALIGFIVWIVRRHTTRTTRTK